jgi:copper transport protein
VTASAAATPRTVGEVLGTRFGTVWGLGMLAWLAVGAVVLWRRPAPVPVLRSASVGATGLALPRARAGLVALAVPLGALALLPALSGHAGTEQPAWLWLPGNIVHVVAASAWFGGLVALVVALRAATGALEPADRTRLLAAVVGRFSALAGIAVAALLATGVLQGLLAVGAVHELWDTAYGRAVLVKLAAFAGLVALGAVNRQRLLPRLRRAAQGREAPGATGGALRRSLRAEVLLGLVALGATGALASTQPAESVAAGPFAGDAVAGPARVELTVDPARVGANQVHLYLFDRRDGRQLDVPEVKVSAALPSRGIAPITLKPERAGPGHQIVQSAALGVPGTWRVAVDVRVSDFDQYRAVFTTPVR